MSALTSATAVAAATPPRLPRPCRRTHHATGASGRSPQGMCGCLSAPVCVAHLSNATPRHLFVFEL